MNPSADLVNKLWRLCSLLRKDGVTYQQYVTELTYLLFLKMASEQKDESRIPEQYRWGALKTASETEVLQRYRQALTDLGDGTKIPDRSVVAIFQNAATIIRTPANLRQLIDAIDGLHWFSDERDAFGDAYEGLLQKMAEETKRGAGQYFTPRVLIEVIVDLMKPQPGEVIQDPATGTGGFLIAANGYMKARSDDYYELSPKQQAFQLREALRGIENVPDTFRLLLMNLHLHAIDPDHLDLADTLGPAGQRAQFKNADLILTNPPFGPAGGPPTRDDLTITDRVSSYQLPFVEHVIRALRLGGRAAVVVPDNVLFDDGRGKQLRQRLMSWCDLHTILRLPMGLFYAQGVKTNVLFFTRADEEAPLNDATRAIWIYDARTNVPNYGKANPFKVADLAEFVQVFGEDPNGNTARVDQGPEGRFRRFTREDIAERGDNLDIRWLNETDGEDDEGLTAPEDIAAAIEGHLKIASGEIADLISELESGALDYEPDETALPPGWAKAAIADIVEINPKHPSDVTRTQLVSFVPMPSVDESLGAITASVDRKLEEVWTGYTHFADGDVIFAKITPCMENGKAAIASKLTNGRACGSTEFYVLRPEAGNEASYIWRFIRQKSFRQEAEKHMSGAVGQRRVPRAYLESHPIPLPPAQEQRRIVAKLDALTAQIARTRAELAQVARLVGGTKSNALLDRLEATILAKAFRGELVPQDPDDEPASVLLDRIRAKRASAPKAKRARRVSEVA